MLSNEKKQHPDVDQCLFNKESEENVVKYSDFQIQTRYPMSTRTHKTQGYRQLCAALPHGVRDPGRRQAWGGTGFPCRRWGILLPIGNLGLPWTNWTNK